jgi:hypothetical protein
MNNSANGIGNAQRSSSVKDIECFASRMPILRTILKVFYGA